MMFPLQIEKICLDPQSENDPITRTVLERLPDVPVEIVQDKKYYVKRFSSMLDPIGTGKRQLFITRFYGRRLKPCPGTSNHICCGYYVINTVTNCPMDCSYCVLQGYLNNPYLTLYTNWEDLLQEIDDFLSENRQSLFRLGTGELSDSLALEPIFPVSQILIDYFAKSKKGILELKTKSANVDSLLRLNHQGRTVISWSLNAPDIIQEEEIGTASLNDRIESARKCQEQGYLLGFHFDPILYFPGWEEGYQNTLQQLFKRVDPERVAWVSLGGFRYPPKLKAIALERFPKTKIFLGELFPGKDAKFRYFKEIRIEIYQKMATWLESVSPDLFVYLCMESQEVWEKVFGWSPVNTRQLNQMFEKRMKVFLD